MKPTVRWRFLSDSGHWSTWTVNGRRIIVDDPKLARKGKKEKFEDRVLKVLKHPLVTTVVCLCSIVNTESLF